MATSCVRQGWRCQLWLHHEDPKPRRPHEAVKPWTVSLVEVVKSLRRLNMPPPKHALCFGHGYEAYSNGFEGSLHPDRDRTVIRARGSYFRGVRGNCGWINPPYGLFIRLVQEVIR